MASLHASDIADLVATTQRDLGKAKLTDLTTDLQEHVALSQLMRKERVGFDSGYEIQFQLLTKTDGNARHVGLFDVDNLNQVDGVIAGTIPWRHTTGGYIIERRQILMNRNPAKIVDFVKTKRQQSLIDMAALMEPTFWGEPSSSTDVDTPFGIRYYVVYNGTEGFNGGNNSNFSTGPAGINRTTYARWKNYTAQYTNVTKTDLVAKWRRAAWSCNFKPPIQNAPIGPYGAGGRYGYYTTYDTLALLETIAEAQNDSLGNDIAAKDGLVTMRRVPVTAVPYLQTNQATADPVVGIDWSVFKTIYLEGDWFHETIVNPAPNQHNVVNTHVDVSYNWVCYDCRRLFLLAKSTWH